MSSYQDDLQRLRRRHFDYYVRSFTTAVLAFLLVGAAVYGELFNIPHQGVLETWAGLVIGVYFTYHVARNGSDSPPFKEEAELMRNGVKQQLEEESSARQSTS